MKDKIIENLIEKETERQVNNLELIASENYVSDDVYAALGSIFTNKYAEGYPGRRYYGGCSVVDEVEQLAIDRVCQLFKCNYANVQPHSGTQANRAVTEALIKPGDTVLALGLNFGAHLTHSSSVSYIGKYYNVITYTCTEDGIINYKELEDLAFKYNPKLIIGGASAYSRDWDHERIRETADVVGAYYMYDMAHTAGLIAAGLLSNPLHYAHVVTSTTHKTLRGPRGGFILTNDADIIKKINSSVFPGNQGGPLMNVIAAKAVCFNEALQDSFKEYQIQTRTNAMKLADYLQQYGYKIVSGGTINHEFLIDLRTKFPDMTGADAEKILEECGITVNKNMIPNDSRTPKYTSGIRIGTPAITSRGITEMGVIAALINRALQGEDPIKIKKEVLNLINKHKDLNIY